jgi:peroxiredoxin
VPCNSQLRSYQDEAEKLAARGVRLVAISVDPPEVTREHARKLGFGFTFLSDEKRELIRRYDLLHRGGGPEGSDISLSAEFLLDGSGTVRWQNLRQGEGPKYRTFAHQFWPVLDRVEGQSRK